MHFFLHPGTKNNIIVVDIDDPSVEHIKIID